jgi:hypothetical protein
MKKKIISAILAVFLIVWLTLFALGRISALVFWIPVIAVAIFAYKILPRLQ